MAGGDRELESAIDELYALPPEGFVGARTALARERRAAGDREGADRVASLRKPTAPAWTLNQLARRDRPGIDALVEAGEELARAQRKAMAGGRRADLQEATARRRQAVERLVERARQILTDAGHAAAPADRVADTLMAMATDPELTETVRAGRLEREAPPPAGFGAIPGLELEEVALPSGRRGGEPARRGRSRAGRREEGTDEVAARRSARQDREQRAGEREAEAARERAEALEASAAEAEEEAGRLEGEAETRERQAGEAREEADRLQQAAREARIRAEEAEREARLARRRADRSRTEAGRARAEADRARARLSPS